MTAMPVPIVPGEDALCRARNLRAILCRCHPDIQVPVGRLWEYLMTASGSENACVEVAESQRATKVQFLECASHMQFPTGLALRSRAPGAEL